MSREIVKVQLPLMTNGPAEAFVYNEERDVEFFMPIDESLEKVMDGSPKKFFEVSFIPDPEVEGAEKMEIHKEVNDPGW